MKKVGTLIIAFVALSCAHAQDSRELFKQGFDLYKARNFANAEVLFKRGLEGNSRDAMAWSVYGEVLEAQAKNMLAKKAYGHALDLAPPGADKVLLEAKVKNLKPSLVPGEKCRDLVELLDPSKVKTLIDKLVDIPAVEPGTVTTLTTRNTKSSYTWEPCGDAYVYQVARSDSGNETRGVFILGYPQFGTYVSVHGNEIMRMNSTGMPFAFTQETFTFTQDRTITPTRTDAPVLSSQCTANKKEFTDNLYIFEADCGLTVKLVSAIFPKFGGRVALGFSGYEYKILSISSSKQ